MDRADGTHQHPAPDEVGRLLAESREAYGLSVGDVASRLRLSPRQIEALEAEDYERLPGKTFIRGFVRNYARLLQMDPAPLLAALEHALPESRASEILPRTENIPFSTGKPDGWRRYLLLLVLLLVVIPLVLFEAYRDRSATEAPLSAPAPVAVPPAAAPAAGPTPPAAPAADASRPAAEAPRPVADVSAPPAVENARPPVAAKPPEPAAIAPATAPEPVAERGEAPAVVAAQPVTPPAAGRATLHFRFAQESWVEVRNASGEVVASRLNAPESEWTVRGRLPLALVVGNADGVRLEVDGKPVKLEARPGSGVARLTLE